MTFEGPEVETKPNLESEARALLEALRSGRGISNEIRMDLVAALLAAPNREQSTERREVSVWDAFQTDSARAEHDRLSEADKNLIVYFEQRLKESLAAFRVSQTKPIGTTDNREDYRAFDILPGDFARLNGEIISRLSPEVLQVLSLVPGQNHAILFAHPTDKNLCILYSVLFTPPRTSKADSRAVPHEYALTLRRETALPILEQGDALRLFPFIIQTLGMESVKRGWEVYFDGSFAGRYEVFGSGRNPMALIDVEKRRVATVEGSFTAVPAVVQQASTDKELASYMLSARGQTHSPTTFQLQGASHPLPRHATYERNSL